MYDRGVIFARTTLREHVKVLPREIGRNIRDILLTKLQNKLEGVCSRHGYVRPGSLKVHTVSHGHVEGASLNGDTHFVVTVIADVCNPLPGHVIPARIVNSNKFGFLAHSGIEINGRYTTILETVITRHAYLNSTTDVSAETINVGQDVLIEVLGKTFELNDTRISVAGRVLQILQPSASTANKRVLLSTAVANATMMDDPALDKTGQDFMVEEDGMEKDSDGEEGGSSAEDSDEVDDESGSGNEEEGEEDEEDDADDDAASKDDTDDGMKMSDEEVDFEEEDEYDGYDEDDADLDGQSSEAGGGGRKKK